MPRLVWLSGRVLACERKGHLVQFPVRAHALVAGQVPSRGHVRGNRILMFPSLFFFLPLCQNINKIFKKKKIKKAILTHVPSPLPIRKSLDWELSQSEKINTLQEYSVRYGSCLPTCSYLKSLLS